MRANGPGTNYPAIASALLLVAGLGLLAMMVSTEGEPGALPLALVLVGGVGLWLTRRRKRAARSEPE